MKTLRHIRILMGFVWLLFILIVGVIQLESVSAQSILSLPASQTGTYTGWLSIRHGDPLPNSNLPPRIIKRLVDDQGIPLVYLVMDDNTAHRFDKHWVQVTVQADIVGAANVGGLPTYTVIAIEALAAGQQIESRDVSAQLVGSQPYINLLCSFPDIDSPPKPLSWYQGLLGSSYPALGHYWSQTSYNNINLNGSDTTPQWYPMPHPQDDYLFPNGAADLDSLLQDCIQATNSAVNFANFVGINMFFDGELDCCAWGGWADMTLDGSFKRYQLTWLPSGVDLATIGHEMGHGFGLPHSSGPASHPPTGLNIYVSSWDIMSRSSNYLYSVYDSVYEYLPPGTIAHHRDMLNWIPANRKTVFNLGQGGIIALEQLQLPQANSNYLLAKVPIGGSSTRFYTVEVRTHSGYDQSVPGTGVIIHHVDVNRAGNAGHALVVDRDTDGDVNDDGAMWLPGETFTDAANKIQVSVLSSTPTSFTVYISNNVSPSAAPLRNFYTTATQNLRWSAVSWASGYRIQVDDEMGFNNPPVNQVVQAHQLSFGVTLTDGNYYWRVCALKTALDCGSWSPIERFTVDVS